LPLMFSLRVREIQRFQTFKCEQGEFKSQRKAEFRAGSTQWLRPASRPPSWLSLHHKTLSRCEDSAREFA
jgi:hypothetical protein